MTVQSTSLMAIIFGSLVIMTAPEDPECKLELNADMLPFYDIGNRFIEMVQPNSFPTKEVQMVIDHFTGASGVNQQSLSSLGQRLLTYEMGFLALFVIGAIFIILMPLIGIGFCCCRCCNLCGGKRFQREPVSTLTCVTLSLILGAIFICMLAGVTLFCVNAKDSSNAIPTGMTNAKHQFSRVTDFAVKMINDGGQEVDDLVDETVMRAESALSNQTDRLIASMKNISRFELILRIVSALGEAVDEAKDLELQIENYNRLVAGVSQEVVTIVTEYNARNAITLDSSRIEADLLAMVTPMLDMLVKNVTQALDTQHKYAAYRVADKIQMRLRLVRNRFGHEIHDLILEANNFYKRFNRDKLINNTVDSINKIRNNIDDADAKLDVMGVVNNLQTVILATLLSLILVLILFGLCCGSLGYSEKRRPFERSSISDTGGCCLLWSVATAFLFTWYIMYVAVTCFTVGYFTQTLICTPVFQDPVQQRALSNLLEKNIFTPSRGSTPTTSSTPAPAFKFDFADILDQCRLNRTLSSATHLQIKLNDILNIQYIKELVNGSMEHTDSIFHVQTARLISYVWDFHDEMANFTGQLQGKLTSFLSVYSRHEPSYSINALNNIRTTATNAASLERLLDGIAVLQNEGASIEANFSALITSTQILRMLTEKLGVIRGSFDMSEEIKYVAGGDENTSNEILGIIRSFSDGFDGALRDRIGHCRPLYDIFMCAGDILCKQVLYPLQGTWMSLGWCMLWSVPAMIVAVLLSKYFRQMNARHYDTFNRPTPHTVFPHIPNYVVPAAPQIQPSLIYHT